MRNETVAETYTLPEIYDSNNDIVTLEFGQQLPDFISYETNTNMLIYNLSLLSTEVQQNNETYNLEIRLEDSNNAYNSYELEIQVIGKYWVNSSDYQF